MIFTKVNKLLPDLVHISYVGMDHFWVAKLTSAGQWSIVLEAWSRDVSSTSRQH